MPRKMLAVIKRKMHILNMLFFAIFLIKKKIQSAYDFLLRNKYSNIVW